MLVFIFEYLPVRNLVTCAMVCERWRFVVGDIRIRELIINNHQTKKAGDLTWFHTGDSMNKMYAFDGLDTQAYLLFVNCFRHKLARLCLIERKSLTKPFIERLLNQMKQLVHLELTISRSDNKSSHVVLQLPNLQTFKLFSSGDKYRINSPKLKNVQLFMCPNEIDFSHPQSIKYLQVKYVNCGHEPSNFNLTKFPNLETLRVSIPKGPILDLYWHVIDSLSNLKQLYFDRPQHFQRCDYRIIDDFDHILKHRTVSSEELQIYFLNVLLVNHRKFENYNFFETNLFLYL